MSQEQRHQLEKIISLLELIVQRLPPPPLFHPPLSIIVIREPPS
jgi:hypothetical protein